MIQINGCVHPLLPRVTREFSSPKGWQTRERTAPPDLIVLHWTAGERNADRVAQTLGRRGLSVHFVVNADGSIVQFEDAVTTTTLHAGGANDRSVGIEIVNYAFSSRGRAAPTAGEGRPRATGKVHGHRFVYADFWPAQILSVLLLCEALTQFIPCIPQRVLEGTTLASPGDLELGGIAGHYHLSRRKVDPGPRLLEAVRRHWGDHDI